MPTSNKRRREESGFLGRQQTGAAFLYKNFEGVGFPFPLTGVKRQDESPWIRVSGAISRNAGQVNQDDQVEGARLQPLFPDRIRGAQNLSRRPTLAECKHRLGGVVAQRVA